MRITTVRIIVQIAFFVIFLALSFLTTFANLDHLPGLKSWLSKYLEIDPLIALTTAVTTHTVYKGLLWSLVVLIPTVLLGRFFCGWICPFGSLHHFVGWLLNRRTAKQSIDANRYRPLYAFKYYLLVALLAAGLFGSLQIGLLDPLCLLHRSLTVAVQPVWDMALAGFEGLLGADLSSWRFRRDPAVHQLGWIIGFLFVFLVAMNLAIPRFFCRALCPLGALLGVFSRFSWWRIDRDLVRCTSCNLCAGSCEGACDPHTKLRKSECLVCFNCIEDCPHDALAFRFLPDRAGELANPDIGGRRTVLAGLLGMLFFPFARTGPKVTRDFSSLAIRPPGTVEEQEFLERCVKCGQCIRVCPTNVLQPALFDSGLEGVWSPVMNYRVGFCQSNCTACGQICPTGAIRQISVAEKMGLGPHRKAGPIRLGTAHFDRSRCLPWSKNIPCLVCQEVCPVSPKAIYTDRTQLAVRDATKRVVSGFQRAVRLADEPQRGELIAQPARFDLNQFAGDGTTAYFVEIRHASGLREVHRIVANDIDTVLIDDDWYRPPSRGDECIIMIELDLPKVDLSKCIGCGLCENACPVVGSRRAVYVTAEGETRSQHHQDPHRNRSVQPVARGT